MSTAAAIAEAVDRSWRRDLETSRRYQPTPHNYVYASSYRACLRRMVYEMTVPEQQPALGADVLAKFRRGDDRERDLLADLTAIGRNAIPPFNIIGQQERFSLRDRKSRSVIVGKVDARLEMDCVLAALNAPPPPSEFRPFPMDGSIPLDFTRREQPTVHIRAPIEVKSWSPMLVDRLDTFEDVFANQWTRTGGYQLLAYMLGANEPFGFLLLDRSGVPKLLPVELEPNLDRIDEFLTRAETALDHVVAGTLPDYLDDPDECVQRCPFYGATCNPPIAAANVLELLNDPELEIALERREELRKPGKAFADLDAEIKTRLRGVTRGVCGKFEIRGYWGKQSHLDLPPDVKAKYTRVDERGRFTLQINKLG
jgi:hypothetical protein